MRQEIEDIQRRERERERKSRHCYEMSLSSVFTGLSFINLFLGAINRRKQMSREALEGQKMREEREGGGGDTYCDKQYIGSSPT